MDLTKEISQLQDRIRQLRELRELAVQISDTTCQVEAEISAIDESLPNPKKLSDIKDRTERAQLSHAEDLLKEAYSLIDEILGPPAEDIMAQNAGAPFIPEARGSKDLSLDELISRLPAGKKGNAS